MRFTFDEKVGRPSTLTIGKKIYTRCFAITAPTFMRVYSANYVAVKYVKFYTNLYQNMVKTESHGTLTIEISQKPTEILVYMRVAISD